MNVILCNNRISVKKKKLPVSDISRIRYVTPTQKKLKLQAILIMLNTNFVIKKIFDKCTCAPIKESIRCRCHVLYLARLAAVSDRKYCFVIIVRFDN